MKQSFAKLLLILLCSVLNPTFAQDAWPAKPIRIVVPTAPGVAPDIFARLYANELTKMYKVPVTVENKPGAAAILGIDNVLKSPADGYTMLYAFNAYKQSLSGQRLTT